MILADFENRTADSSLGIAVTEAFRIDLAQSSAVALVPPARIGSALDRMRRTGRRRSISRWDKRWRSGRESGRW